MDWVESDCIRQAGRFAHLMEEYREQLVCGPSITKRSGSAFRELPLAQTLHITAGARGLPARGLPARGGLDNMAQRLCV